MSGGIGLSARLRIELDRPLPERVRADSATILLCAGTAVIGSEPARALELLIDGRPHPVSAAGMGRPELLGARRRAGFWGLAPVSAAPPGSSIVVGLRSRERSRRREEVALGSIAVMPTPPAVPGAGARTVICMATHEPDLALLGAQIASLREQTDPSWVCVISDDASSPPAVQALRALVADDPRFRVSVSPRRLGFYRNFERALELAPADAELIALCDQDDRWHPDKLAGLHAALGDAVLVYCDQRLVDADGRVHRETMWAGRANNHTDLTGILVANTITGAATLFRRELLSALLPFPDTPGFQFHDAWLATTALAAGRIAYVERPLYDYVQHAGAVFGDVTHGPARGRARPRPVQAARAAYFHGYLGRRAQALVALQRVGAGTAPEKRAALERFAGAEASWPALAGLALRGLRSLPGESATLGTELGLVAGISWMRLSRAAARRGWPADWPLGDSSIPPPEQFSQVRLRRWRARLS